MSQTWLIVIDPQTIFASPHVPVGLSCLPHYHRPDRSHGRCLPWPNHRDALDSHGYSLWILV